jgi:uncharacterized lipoprotein YmbA
MRYPRSLAVLILALALAGCASSPVTLLALPPPARIAGAVEDKEGPSVLLRRVTVPGYLDAFPVVLDRTGGALVVSSGTEWAERLSDGVARVLRDALSQRLGASRVLIAGDPRIADADLTIEFLSLEPVGGTLRLDAGWFVTCAARTQSRGGHTHVEVPLAAATPEAVAHATTAALAQFADELATQVPCAARSRPDVRTRATNVSRKSLDALQEPAR